MLPAHHARTTRRSASPRGSRTPTKHWKYNPGDIDERMLWDDYQRAYEIALERCTTEWAPWHLIPSGRKWYRNWAVAALLAEKLRGLDLEWPPAISTSRPRRPASQLRDIRSPGSEATVRPRNEAEAW